MGFNRDKWVRNSGFTLIEIAVVLVILGFVLTMVVGMTKGVAGVASRATTNSHMANAETALVNFAIIQRRLPCPADGGLASDDPQAGREQLLGGACRYGQARGVLPWITLGLPEADAADGYNVRLTYRVAPDLIVAESMNFTTCDNAGGIPTPAATPSRCAACQSGAVGVPGICTQSSAAFAARGLEVRNAAGTKVEDPAVSLGAAFVLLSHGENRGGGYGAGTGVLQEPIVPLGDGEIQNTAQTPLQPFYVNDNLVESPPSAHFDDVVSSPPIVTFAQRAGLGPRVHTPG